LIERAGRAHSDALLAFDHARRMWGACVAEGTRLGVWKRPEQASGSGR
jgi:hypothetical protein